MSTPDRAVTRPRLVQVASLLVVAIVLAACASAGVSPSPTPGGSVPPQPSATAAGAVTLEGVPTACIGLGEGDCRRVAAHVASLLTADDPRIGYVQVGPFGCAAVAGCPTTLVARSEGDITLEFAGGAKSFHIKVTDGNLDAQPQEAFGIELPPTSRPPIPGGPQPFSLGHCGIWSGIDHGGSWWDPVGLVDYDHSDAINAAEGTISPVGGGSGDLHLEGRLHRPARASQRLQVPALLRLTRRGAGRAKAEFHPVVTCVRLVEISSPVVEAIRGARRALCNRVVVRPSVVYLVRRTSDRTAADRLWLAHRNGDPTLSYAVTNPATGETVKTYDTITDAELEAAVAAADEAHRTWSKSTTVDERAALIRRVSELHRERSQELAELIVREMGKPIGQALSEVDFAADIYEYYADHSPDFLKDEPIQLLAGDGSAVIRRSSLGVLLGVMPWNFPYYQVARFAGPNLIIGNTILLKHAAQCPESAAAIQQIFLDAGFPTGAYVNVYATHDQLERVIADPRVQGVSLTGSERAGAAVAEIAGRHLKKVVLELGGSDPFVLLSTDDLDATVQNAVDARLDNSGQSCNAAKRFIVADELYEPFLEKFTAKIAEIEATDPTSADSALGPLSSLKAAENIDEQVKRAIEHGAKLAHGGSRNGAFFQTTVLTDVTPENPASKEEFFGPVAQVYRAKDEADAVRIANDTPFGLGSYVYTTDQEQALRVADGIEAGMVFVNVVLADGVELPFGGIKRSGSGRELGRFGADEFVNKKMIRIG